jgi:2-oxoglutarate ferredoxin oxidoreductase subunit alpha
MMDVNIRVAGEAGQGVQTTGQLLATAFAESGRYIFASQSYMSRIRGGVNWFDIRVSDKLLTSSRTKADILVALTADALNMLRSELSHNGVVLCDRAGCDQGSVDFSGLAKSAAGSALMANTVAAGAVFALLGLDSHILDSFLRKRFGKKGEEVVAQNIAAANSGAQAVKQLAGRIPCPASSNAPHAIVNGSDACGLSAAVSGVKVACSYPMTPSTGVFTYLAQVASKYGIVVEQAEDEIAAVNLICGSTYAGAPSVTTTSGGGFALMAEGISNAGICELPIFIFLSQRPGPATGLPTRTGQEDLMFSAFAGHGEFPRLIFAPGNVAQCYSLVRHALQQAHKWQSPTIFLIDQFLADTLVNTPPLSGEPNPIDPCIVPAAEDYQRYRLTANGVSPRAIPGGDGLVVTDSDEHDETGHLTEDLAMRIAQQNKRMKKVEGMCADFCEPQWYGDEAAHTVLICWGSTWCPCREAVDLLNGPGGGYAMLHFPQLWPLPADKCRNALRVGGREYIVVEGNCTGQFAQLLRMNGILGDHRAVLRNDGMPFTGEEIAFEVKK